MSGLTLTGVDVGGLIERSPFLPDSPVSESAPAVVPAMSTRPVHDLYELRGIYWAGGEHYFSVWSREGRQSRWLRLSESSGGFFPEIVQFDPVRMAAATRFGGQSGELRLVEKAFGGQTQVPRADEGLPRGPNMPPNFVPPRMDEVDMGSGQEDRPGSGARSGSRPLVRRTSPEATSLPRRAEMSTAAEAFPAVGGVGRRVLSGPPGRAQLLPPGVNPTAEGNPAEGGVDLVAGGSESKNEPSDDEEVVELLVPEQGPPPVPQSRPPAEIPQLPPGFDLEKFLEEQRRQRAR